MRRRAALLAGAATLALPASAQAHGIGTNPTPGLPAWLFAWGAAIVLVVSFVALGALWQQPRLQHPRERRLVGVARILDPLCGALGVLVFAGLVYAGIAGSQNPLDNIVPTSVYIYFWVAIPVVSALFGDVFAAFSPWRAVGRAARWLTRGVELPAALPYPPRLGRWPAVLTIVGFGWLELAYTNRDDPSTLALLGLGYAAVQLVAMSIWGLDEWERQGDGFGVYFGLFARLSPLRWRDGAVWLRRPLEGTVSLDTTPGTVALLCAAIGVTSFDGFSSGPSWTSLAPHIQHLFTGLGASLETGLELAYTIGLIAVVLVVAGFYRLGISGMRSVDERFATGDLSRRFVHTLVPIALAYVIAHYFSLLVYQGQAMAYLASDPLGRGSDLLGTASTTIDYSIIGATGIWIVQVVALVLGHVSGLTLAHDRALATYDRVRAATRSQYWMLAVMVGFTSLGLWLLSAVNQ